MRSVRIGAVGARPGAFNTVRYSEKILERHGISVTTVDLSEILAAAGIGMPAAFEGRPLSVGGSRASAPATERPIFAEHELRAAVARHPLAQRVHEPRLPDAGLSADEYRLADSASSCCPTGQE